MKQEDNATIDYKKMKIIIKRIVLVIWIFIFFIMAVYGVINVILWLKDNKEIRKQINEINEITEISEVEDNDNIEIINPPEDVKDIYWYYNEIALIDVDFNELKKKNSDTVGWIKVEGTNINYPIVQSNDNKYYLNRDFNKKKNSGGWIFLDYRNDIQNLEKNTILYGHGLRSKAMFGSLNETLKESWYKNISNHIIRISTPTENTMWQIFSIYKTPVTGDYLMINFSSNKYYQEFLNELKNRSTNEFNTTVNSYDIILTLSTCDNNIGRLVVHAKLIKRESKGG